MLPLTVLEMQSPYRRQLTLFLLSMASITLWLCWMRIRCLNVARSKVQVCSVPYLGQHGLEAGSRLGMQTPGDISCGALQVLLALPSAQLLSFLYECMIGGPNPLEEQVMPIQELAVPLQQVHCDGEHPSQDVGKSVAQLHSTESFSQLSHHVRYRYCERVCHKNAPSVDCCCNAFHGFIRILCKVLSLLWDSHTDLSSMHSNKLQW